MLSEKVIPAVGWLKTYSKLQFRGDLVAGLTVGVMLIPQGMAYSMLAGLPPIYGLYASTVPLIVYALFGTSRQLAVGPVAMVSLLIASGVSQIAEGNPDLYLSYSILLALLVGLIQFSMGLFRLGFLVNFLSHPVISGFTSAAAIIIGLSQVKHLLGVSLPRTSHIHDTLSNIVLKLSEVHVPTLILGSASIILLLFIKKYLKKIPGPIIAVLIAVVITWFFRLDESGISILQSVPGGLPSIKIPLVDFAIIGKLFGVALPIALIGYMESIAVAKAIQAKKKNYVLSSNQELIGLGLANIGGAFFQAFPTTGGFSRTAVNDQAGAQTGMASIISAFLIILTLLFLTPLFYYLPKAILAAVIMVAVFGLIDVKEPKALFISDKRDFVLLLVTFILTLVMGVEIGILTGVFLSLVMVVYSAAYPHMAVLGKLKDTRIYRNVERFEQAEEREDVLIVRVDAQMFFANASYIHDYINEKADSRKGLKLIILSMEAVSQIDSSAMHMIKDLISEYKNQKVAIYMVSSNGPVRDKLKANGVIDCLGEYHFFNFVDEAMDFYSSGADPDVRGEEKDIALQSNIE